METRTEQRNKMQAPTLVAIVVGLHVMAVGSIVFIQGCGTTRGPTVEPPPAPVMPPQTEVREARPVTPAPVFHPPMAVEEAPMRMPDADPRVYEVRRGDNLSTIARRHGVTSAELVDLNQLKDPNAIRIGQTLLLPAHARSTPAPARPAAPAADRRAPAPAEAGATYVVQAGDSLSRIASRHGVTVAALSAANNITDPNRIRVGQKVVIPGASAVEEPAPPRRQEQPQPGREERAPQPAAAVTPAPAPADPGFTGAQEPFPYTVRAGETFDSVARDFAVLKGDLLRLNNMSGEESLRPGQTLMIPPLQ